jgi:hypothetical protein
MVFFVAIKYFWPLMKQSLDTQITQGRTESGLLRQVIAERDKALAERDRAEQRADELFAQLADVQAQLKIMAFQLESAKAQLGPLSTKLDHIEGVSNA